MNERVGVAMHDLQPAREHVDRVAVSRLMPAKGALPSEGPFDVVYAAASACVGFVERGVSDAGAPAPQPAAQAQIPSVAPRLMKRSARSPSTKRVRPR
jgi:hypothetical protein